MTDELAVNATSPTPQSWPANAYPTPEQLAEWLTLCTDEERVTLCAKMLDSSERASRCFMEQHDELLEEMRRFKSAIEKAVSE